MSTLQRFMVILLAVLAANIASAQTAQDLADTINTNFTVTGSVAPYELQPNGGATFMQAAIAVRDYMIITKGWTLAMGALDASTAGTNPVPVIWRGLTSIAAVNATKMILPINNPGGALDPAGKIMLGTGISWTVLTNNGGAAWVEASNLYPNGAAVTNVTVYAVGGDPHPTGGNGGAATARNLGVNGSGTAGAWAHDGIDTGNGGAADGECASSHLLLRGGNTDRGNGGACTVLGTTAGEVNAVCGSNNGNAGTGGSFTCIFGVGSEMNITAGNSGGTGNAGSVTISPPNGQSVTGTVSATAGTAFSSGAGGGVTIAGGAGDVIGNVTAVAGNASSGAGGSVLIANGGAGAQGSVTGNVVAYGGDSSTGTGGSVTIASGAGSGQVDGDVEAYGATAAALWQAAV